MSSKKFKTVYTGFAGILAVIVTNLTARIMGFDNRPISKGVYGFNSLLVGLCLGISFSPGVILYVIIILASVMTLFFAVSMQGVIGKYGLPGCFKTFPDIHRFFSSTIFPSLRYIVL